MSELVLQDSFNTRTSTASICRNGNNKILQFSNNEVSFIIDNHNIIVCNVKVKILK